MFRAIAQFGGLNIVFDPAFREETIDADLRNMTLDRRAHGGDVRDPHVLPCRVAADGDGHP